MVSVGKDPNTRRPQTSAGPGTQDGCFQRQFRQAVNGFTRIENQTEPEYGLQIFVGACILWAGLRFRGEKLARKIQ